MNCVKMENGAFPTATPESQGVPSRCISDFLAEVRKLNVDLHAFYMFKNGYLIAEGHPKPFQARTPHRIYSAAKSITAVAALFAISEGKLHLDDKIVDFFPDDLPETVSDNLRAMTVYDVMTMTTGQEEDPFEAMRTGHNWVKSFFSVPVVHKPGARFLYNNGVPHIVGMLVYKATGMDYVEYLRPRFLDPLDIYLTVEYTDEGEREGSTTTCTAEGIAKLTLFLLQNGMWDGKQLLDPELVKLACSKLVPSHHHGDDKSAYGYGLQIWRNERGGFQVNGGRGQIGIGIPELNLAIAWTAWELDITLATDLVSRILYEHQYARPIEETEEVRAEQRQLAERLAGWSCAPEGLLPERADAAGGQWELSENVWKIERVGLDFGRREISLSTPSERCVLKYGVGGDWADNPSFIEMPYRDTRLRTVFGVENSVRVSGGWTEGGKFVFQVRNSAWMSYDTFTCNFSDGLTLTVENSDDVMMRTRPSVAERFTRAPYWFELPKDIVIRAK